MKTFEKRIAELESQIIKAANSPVWIDGKNATVRADIGKKRGEEVTFPSVFEAGKWLERQINIHFGGVINYSVDNICDLYEDAGELRAHLKLIIPDKIVVPDLAPRLKEGEIVWEEKSGPENHPVIFDADTHFPATLGLSKIEPEKAADLPLWALASLIDRYFSTGAFRDRYLRSAFTQDDNKMFYALLLVYSWHKPGTAEELNADFFRLFLKVTELPALP